MKLRKIEGAKVDYTRKLLDELSISQVKYHEVRSHQVLLDVMDKM